MNYEAIAFWSQIVSTVAFIAVVVWLWIRYLEPSILAAQESSLRQIAEAVRHRDDAKAALDALQGEIDGAKRDAALIKERGETEAQRELDASVAEAKDAGERAVRNAQGELDRALAAARENLRRELLDKAFTLARGEARRRMDGAVNGRLVEEFVASLETDRG